MRNDLNKLKEIKETFDQTLKSMDPESLSPVRYNKIAPLLHEISFSILNFFDHPTIKSLTTNQPETLKKKLRMFPQKSII